MRTAFVEEITKLAEKDKNVWLLTGDLGFSVFDDFQKKFPKQYLNVGVAEQDLISIAAGLAMSGKKIFAYSISTFVTMRPLEQIRNDLCYQDLPVYLIGGGSTFSYSTFGCTHFPLEDLGLMRILPNMAVAAPGDPLEVRALVRGRQLPNALTAASILREQGIKCRVLSFHTMKPLDKAAIINAAKETKGLITIEEHFKNGGLGTAVAETLAREGLSVPLVNIGIDDEFPKGSGSQEYFLKKYGLTPEGILGAVVKILNRE